jgi:putative ABC transport system substrate-binding protein
MSICLRRREFIAGLGGAAAWPLAARAQQRPMPVIGYLSSRTADSDASMLDSLRRGLADVGYAEGRNVVIDYRFTDGRYDRLSARLTDLTQRKIGVTFSPASSWNCCSKSAPHRSRSSLASAPIR